MVSTIRLSTDELAFAFLVNDQPVAAQQMLLSSVGRELSKEEAQGRLSAAGNILFGQGLVDIREDGSLISSPILSEVARVLTAAAATLRFSLSSPAGQAVLSYHFINDAIYEHWLERGVVHVIARVSEEAIAEGCVNFFDLAERPESPTADALLPDAVFRQAMRQTDVAAAADMLRSHGVEESLCALLAEDMVQTQAIGDMLAIYYSGAERAPMSDEGRLVVLGQKRYWLFQPLRQGDEVWVKLLPSTMASMREHAQQLAQVCQQIAAQAALAATNGAKAQKP